MGKRDESWIVCVESVVKTEVSWVWYTRGVSPDDISAQHVTQEFERPEISLEPWFWDQQISTDETFSGALQTGDMIPKGVP